MNESRSKMIQGNATLIHGKPTHRHGGSPKGGLPCGGAVSFLCHGFCSPHTCSRSPSSLHWVPFAVCSRCKPTHEAKTHAIKNLPEAK
ncbi:MAG: hypothetical protein ACKVOM_08025 [Ferruginibacter sp.]